MAKILYHFIIALAVLLTSAISRGDSATVPFLDVNGYGQLQRSDLAKYRVQEWRILLLHTGQTKVGDKAPWGEFHGSSEDEVKTLLGLAQRVELALKRGGEGQRTFRVFYGPVAVLKSVPNEEAIRAQQKQIIELSTKFVAVEGRTFSGEKDIQNSIFVLSKYHNLLERLAELGIYLSANFQNDRSLRLEEYIRDFVALPLPSAAVAQAPQSATRTLVKVWRKKLYYEGQTRLDERAPWGEIREESEIRTQVKAELCLKMQQAAGVTRGFGEATFRVGAEAVEEMVPAHPEFDKLKFQISLHEQTVDLARMSRSTDPLDLQRRENIFAAYFKLLEASARIQLLIDSTPQDQAIEELKKQSQAFMALPVPSDNDALKSDIRQDSSDYGKSLNDEAMKRLLEALKKRQ